MSLGSSLRKNEILLSSSMVIKNDTQSELPNNRNKSQLPAPRVLAQPTRRVSAHTTPLLPDVRLIAIFQKNYAISKRVP